MQQLNRYSPRRKSESAVYGLVTIISPAIAKLLTKDAARRIAANIGKLPDLLERDK